MNSYLMWKDRPVLVVDYTIELCVDNDTAMETDTNTERIYVEVNLIETTIALEAGE